MTPEQDKDLHAAVKLLENPSLAARIADVVGTPIEKVVALLPEKAHHVIRSAAEKAILGALKAATATMSQSPQPESSDWWHMGAVAASGFAGGFFGLAGLLVEVPVSTTIMLRSIADIARSEGADLGVRETQIDCVQVLALGGKTPNDDGSEIGYFLAREALVKMVADASAHIAKHGFATERAPALVRLVIAVAERYSIQISEKAAAQLLPVIGGVGGALVNSVFIAHFQDVARGHFIVRRLERSLGHERVKVEYRRVLDEQRGQPIETFSPTPRSAG